MVMRQQPMALHARRSLIPNASRRWTTAFRFPAGVTTSFPKVVQRRVVEHGIGQQPLQSRVLVFQRPQPFSLGDIQAAESGLPFVDARVAHAVLAAQIGDCDAGLVLLQYPDDLLFRKAAALHALVLVLGQSELQTGLSPRGKVTWTIRKVTTERRLPSVGQSRWRLHDTVLE